MDYKKLRNAKKLSQMAVAARCGVSLVTYQLWERNISTPTEDNQKKLNEVLEIKQ